MWKALLVLAIILLALIAASTAMAGDGVQNLGHGPVIAARFYSAGQRVIVSDDQNRVLNVASGQELFKLAGPGLHQPQVTWDGGQIVGFVGPDIKMYKASDGTLLTTLDSYFSNDIQDMIAYTSQTAFVIFKPQAFSFVNILWHSTNINGWTYGTSRIAVAPNHSRSCYVDYYSGYSYPHITLLNTWNNYEAESFDYPFHEKIHALAFTADNTKIAIKSESQSQIYLYDWTGNAKGTLPLTDNGEMQQLKFSSDGKWMVARIGQKINVCAVATGAIGHQFDGLSVLDIDVSADAKYLLAAGTDNSVAIYDLNNGHLIKTLLQGGGEGNEVALAPNGGSVASNGEKQHTLTVYNAYDNAVQMRASYEFQQASVYGFAETVTPMLVTNSSHALLINGLTGAIERQLPCPLGTFSGDGRTVMVIDGSNVNIYDTLSGAHKCTLANVPSSVAISQDGKTLVAGKSYLRYVPANEFPGAPAAGYYLSYDLTAWETATGQQLNYFYRSEYAVAEDEPAESFALSGDGKRAIIENAVYSVPEFTRLHDLRPLHHRFLTNYDASVIYGYDDDSGTLFFTETNTTRTLALGETTALNFSPDGSKLIASRGAQTTIYDVRGTTAPVSMDLRANANHFKPGSSLQVAWNMDLLAAGSSARFELIPVGKAVGEPIVLSAVWAPLGAALSKVTIPSDTPNGNYRVRVSSTFDPGLFADSAVVYVGGDNAVAAWVVYE